MTFLIIVMTLGVLASHS